MLLLSSMGTREFRISLISLLSSLSTSSLAGAGSVGVDSSEDGEER